MLVAQHWPQKEYLYHGSWQISQVNQLIFWFGLVFGFERHFISIPLCRGIGDKDLTMRAISHCDVRVVEQPSLRFTSCLLDSHEMRFVKDRSITRKHFIPWVHFMLGWGHAQTEILYLDFDSIDEAIVWFFMQLKADLLTDTVMLVVCQHQLKERKRMTC